MSRLRFPVYPAPEDILYFRGRHFAVEWYYTAGGELPGLAYYRSMRGSERQRLDFMVKYLADSPAGTLLPATMFRIEDRENRIFALKAGPQRFFNFTTDGAKIILTNAFRKHSQKLEKKDLDVLGRAIRFRQDYLLRAADGTYYENQA